MRYLSLCSGIEAASVAWAGPPLHWTPVGFAEIEPFPCAVLKHHYPEVPNIGDITALDFVERAKALAPVDLVVGGPPCQAFSVAGLQNSLDDARGNLTLRYREIVHALRPAFALYENVPGLLNTHDNAFGCFLAGMVGADAPLVSPLKRGRWTDAGMVVGPHGKLAWRVLDARYFKLAQRRRRVFAVWCPGDGADPSEVLLIETGVRLHPGKGRQARQGPAPTIGGGPPFSRSGPVAHVEQMPTMVRRGEPPYIAFRTNQTSAHGPIYSEEITDTLGQDHPPAVCFESRLARNGRGAPETVVPPLKAQSGESGKGDAAPLVLVGWQARWLFPEECERLQGFPSGHTQVPYRGKPATDGLRYKAIGNSMATTVVRWIGQRIQAVGEIG